MTYSATELSAQDGSPVRLLEFRRGQIVYRYTNADVDVVWDSETWESRPGGFQDGGVRSSGPSEQDELSITCAWSNEVVAWFRGTPPSDKVTLTVRRLHLTDGDAEAAVVWVGLVTSMKQTSPGKAELFCQSVLYTLQQEGLRLTYQRTCNHFLYDEGCRVLKSAFGVTATVDSVSGITVSASELDALADGWFSGGFIEWELDLLGTVERRPIESHVGAVLTLLTLTDGLEVGTEVTVYPGCSLDVATCKTKFDNLANFGGIPHLPGQSPFDIGVLNTTNGRADSTLGRGGTGTSQPNPRSGDGSGGGVDGGGIEQEPYIDYTVGSSGG